MDVGGGRGELLARCMLYAGHESKGVLFDRQWVLDRCASVRRRHAACCRHRVACTACDMCSINVPWSGPQLSSPGATASIPSKR